MYLPTVQMYRGPIFRRFHGMHWPPNGSLNKCLDSRFLYRYIHILYIYLSVYQTGVLTFIQTPVWGSWHTVQTSKNRASGRHDEVKTSYDSGPKNRPVVFLCVNWEEFPPRPSVVNNEKISGNFFKKERKVASLLVKRECPISY